MKKIDPIGVKMEMKNIWRKNDSKNKNELGTLNAFVPPSGANSSHKN